MEVQGLNIIFIKRDLSTEYKQTVLGVMYHVLNPIMTQL